MYGTAHQHPIVIIDDSSTTVAILRSLSSKILRSATEVFTDSPSALTYLAGHPASLVVVDYSMPKMTGIELIKQLRAIAHHTSTPVIMLTASSEEAVRKRAGDVGATAFMTKPVVAGEFKACLHECLSNPRSQ